MRVFSFVAATSNSGKTTLIEKVVSILSSRGLRIAVIKHASGGFDIDKPGKDSWRFQQAGAKTVVLAGPGKLAIMKTYDREPTVEELEQSAGDADIVIHEGFKQTGRNKIEVFRNGISGDMPLCLKDSSYLALVSDAHFAVSVPQFDINDAEGVANFLMKS